MQSVVLLSGGLDSAVNLAKAVEETEVRLCINFNYGQRAAAKELTAATNLSKHYNVPLETITLDFLKKITKTSLVNREEDIPKLGPNQLDDKITFETAAQVWVPNRNGIFINIAAAFAETLNCNLIVAGFNKEEATTFPDNSIEFLKSITDSLFFSAANKPKAISFTQDMNKIEIAQLGQKLNLPFKFIWSCYHGGEKMCGQCESCQRFLRATRPLADKY